MSKLKAKFYKSGGIIALLLLMLAGITTIVFQAPHSLDESSLARVENFRLLDESGKSHELFQKSNRKAIVVIAQINGCPILQKSYTAIEKLKTKFSSSEVEFAYINASQQDDRKSIQSEKERFGVTIPVWKDETRTIADSLGLSRSAEAVVIIPGSWRIAYRGAIDDRLDYHGEKISGVRTFLSDAIDSVLAKKKVAVSSYPAKGCNTSEAKPVVAFREVAPILEKKCLSCHFPKGRTPDNLSSIQEIRGWAPMIREVIRTGMMPPWSADNFYGEYADDISLSAEEARKILLWIQSDMPFNPSKDPGKLLPPQKPGSMDDPDIILTTEKPETIPASGLLEYKNYYLGQIKEDTWITSILMRDKYSSKVAHHFDLMFSSEFLPPDEIAKRESEEIRDDHPQESVILTSGNRLSYPSGSAQLVRKGTHLYLKCHYESTGMPEKTQPEVLFWVGKNKNFHRTKTIRMNHNGILIPPGGKLSVEKRAEISNSANLFRCSVHMHLRGASGSIEAILPDKSKRVLLSIPKFLFNRQWYSFAKPISLPAHTEIVARGDFDNSSLNFANPDPTAEVKSGPNINDEMFFVTCWYF